MDNEKRIRAQAKRTERAKKEDVALNRMLIWFGAAVLAEIVLLLMGRYYNAHSTSSEAIMLALRLHQIVDVAVWVLLVLAVVSAVWLVLAWRGGKRVGLPVALTAVFGSLFVFCFVARAFQDVGIQFLCRAVLGVTVLALIYYLYQKEFFVTSVVTAAGILGLWLIRRADGAHMVILYGYMALVAVLVLCVVLVGRKLQQNQGAWGDGEKKRQVLPRSASYGMIYLTCGVVALCLVAALVAGTALAYYLIFALVAWMFIMAVYYTVKQL